MLDDDGNMRIIETKVKRLVEDDELYYPDLPSMDSVDAYINAVISNSHENNNSYDYDIYHQGAELNAQMMVNDLDNWDINRKISMAIGSTIENNCPCSLFTATLSK